MNPNYSSLKVFGITCFPHIRPYNDHKLQFCSQPYTFLGYYHAHKGYKCLAPSGRVYISRHVVFDENTLPFQSKPIPDIDLHQFPYVSPPTVLPPIITSPPLVPSPNFVHLKPNNYMNLYLFHHQMHQILHNLATKCIPLVKRPYRRNLSNLLLKQVIDTS